VFVIPYRFSDIALNSKFVFVVSYKHLPVQIVATLIDNCNSRLNSKTSHICTKHFRFVIKIKNACPVDGVVVVPLHNRCKSKNKNTIMPKIAL
jgi:hypothetical protein